MLKLLQCYRQPGAPRKRSVPLVNDHPAIVDIFRKFFEIGPCIQTISFLVTMIIHVKLKPNLSASSFLANCCWTVNVSNMNDKKQGSKNCVLLIFLNAEDNFKTLCSSYLFC